jgi:AraC family transcriptional regulator, L-rhamnose operon transcriptional activator RhaR
MIKQPAQLSKKYIFSSEDALTLITHGILNGDYPAHSHDFMEIVLVVEGCGHHTSMSSNMNVGRGTVIIIRPGVWHAYKGCQSLNYYNCCFDTRMLQHELAWIREDGLLKYLFWGGPLSDNRRGVFASEMLESLISSCTQHLDVMQAIEDETTSHIKPDLVGHLLLFLGHLARAIVPKFHADGKSMSHPHQAVLEITRLLEAYPSKDWTLSNLARQVHLHPAYLVRLFTAETGLSPIAYLSQLRAERAAALLLNSDCPVSEIGCEVGWSDPSYFARRFKAYFGLSARDYRKRFGQKDGDHPSFLHKHV